MNRDNFDFLYKMFPYHDLKDLNIIIVNQTTREFILESNFDTVLVINSFDKGLSKSRNLAFEKATSDWCLLADDDLIYTRDFVKHIVLGIDDFFNSGVIIFKAQIDQNKMLRNYPRQSKNDLSIFEIMEVASFEVLINRKEVYQRVFFNEFFGLGSGNFNSGEEQIFMNDVRQKINLPVSFVSSVIVQHPWMSTGRDFNRKNRYFTKGAVLKKMFPISYVKWIFIQLFFDLKQGHINVLNVYSKYKEALQGVKKIKVLENE